MKELEMIIVDSEQEIAMLNAKVVVLEKTLVTIHETYKEKIQKAVKAERMRAEEQYRPWRLIYPMRD